jgi:hypothetical protein
MQRFFAVNQPESGGVAGALQHESDLLALTPVYTPGNGRVGGCRRQLYLPGMPRVNDRSRFLGNPHILSGD